MKLIIIIITLIITITTTTTTTNNTNETNDDNKHNNDIDKHKHTNQTHNTTNIDNDYTNTLLIISSSKTESRRRVELGNLRKSKLDYVGPAAGASRQLNKVANFTVPGLVEHLPVDATPCKSKQADVELTPEKVVDSGESCNMFALKGDGNDAAAQEGPAAVAAAVAGRPRGHDPEEESGTQICVLAELARKEEELDPAAQQCLEKLGPAKAAELLQKVVSKGGQIRNPSRYVARAAKSILQKEDPSKDVPGAEVDGKY